MAQGAWKLPVTMMAGHKPAVTLRYGIALASIRRRGVEVRMTGYRRLSGGVTIFVHLSPCPQSPAADSALHGCPIKALRKRQCLIDGDTVELKNKRRRCVRY